MNEVIDIEVGDRVPDFVTSDIYGNTIQMSNYVGNKTLLVFFRFASCPLCTVRFAQLIQNYSTYQNKGLKIIAVFESSPEFINRYITDKRKVPFPIVADLEGSLYKLYNVKKSIKGTVVGMFRIFKMFKGMWESNFAMAKPDGSITRVPADFLIDPLLRVSDCHYGSDIGDHIGLNRINNFIA